MKIRDVFYESLENKDNNIIKNIPVDWMQHATGILYLAKYFEKNFELNIDVKPVLRLFTLYFSGNERFKSELKKYNGINGSLNKGILLIGGVGTGKSLIFKIFKHYTSEILYKNSFQVYTASEIKNDVEVNGIDFLEKFNNNYGNPITCYIDDIASNSEKVNHYGTVHNVIEQLLNVRYNVFSKNRKLTHLSTNKYPAELREVYEIRIVDRMKEMFNIIEIEGKSFRK